MIWANDYIAIDRIDNSFIIYEKIKEANYSGCLKVIGKYIWVNESLVLTYNNDFLYRRDLDCEKIKNYIIRLIKLWGLK